MTVTIEQGVDISHIDELFLTDLYKKITDYNIDLTLTNSKELKYPSEHDTCLGYFTDITRALKVAAGDEFDEWYPVLVHESCHLDQYVEQIPQWTLATIGGVEAINLIELWINHKIELTEQQLWNIIDVARSVEVDCEIRSVSKIKQFKLNIDIENYIRKANAYLYSYNVVPFIRNWTDGAPTDAEQILQLMPTDFNNDYSVIKLHILNKYVDLCKTKPEIPYNHCRIIS